MRIFEVEAGEPDVYVVVAQDGKRKRVYAIESSLRKVSAQLSKVTDWVKTHVLAIIRRK